MKKSLFLIFVIVFLFGCKNQSSVTNNFQGALPGEFSISASNKVHFSQGNLQYKPSTKEWKFAENQYDTIGTSNINISENYDGWIDLFGWGTGDCPTKSDKSYKEYSVFVDWGINAITNGGNKSNKWRTLSIAEWEYIFRFRSNAENLFGFCKVGGIAGLIVLPDEWETNADVNFTPSINKGMYKDEYGYYHADYYSNNGNLYEHNTITIEEWHIMENQGAIFLPAAGERSGTNVSSVGVIGNYHSSTTREGFESDVLTIYFDEFSFNPKGGSFFKSYGHPVRLVYSN